jgi:outer membrane protein assembly factor BamC
MERDGNRRWLVVQQPADQLWPKLKEFWTGNGLVLKRDDPRIGIMETDWAENRADIPGGFIQSVLRKYLDFAYSAPTRDKFRLRVERADDGTAIYLSHYGVEEVAIGGVGQQRSDIVRWQPRPPDPELEAEMLNRLMVYLGASEKRAAAQQAKTASTTRPTARAQLTTVQGQPALLIDQDYARAWRLVGLALDGSNFLVEDQNRGQGRYLVEYREPQTGSADQGWFSKLAFWRESPPPQGTRYQVRLSGHGAQTTVVIQNAQGQPDDSPAAGRLLQTLQEAIK